ncbi:MAG: hypothetical protein ACI9KE_004309 [Polyangiales bacterium]|jgi:hypothetical protein
MPRRPLITLPDIVRLPNIEIPRPRPAPQTSLKVTTRRTISRIKRRLRSADAEYYAVGKELATLDRSAVLSTYREPSFESFVAKYVMPAATAHRYMAVAKEYPEVLALRLGIEKAFHLVQYVRVAKLRRSAKEIAQSDGKVGSPPRALSTLSATDIAGMVQVAKMGAARDAQPKATRQETRAARDTVRSIEAHLGIDARMRINKAKDLVRIDLKLSELLGE